MAADHTVPISLVAAFRGQYELIRETGRGGSAMVYLARDLKHDRFVAIKVLNPDVGPTTGERFLREIQVSAGMQHPHILPMYDSGVADGRLYFVMPFVDGGSLRQRLDAATSLPVDESLKIAHDIAIALAHAHALGVVHRDVKPENIMFYHGHACLADFGVARAIEQLDAGITSHGTIVGTPAYMSPEQVTAEGFDGRSDVYSLACVLYEMIGGTRLFTGSTAREVLLERSRRPSIRKLRPRIPLRVDALLTRALATIPDDRFPDARAFAVAIEDALHVVTPERISAPRRALGSVKEHKMGFALSAVAVVMLAGLAFSPVRNEVALLPARFRNDVAPAARRAFDDGQVALASWNVLDAQRAFASAVAADPLAAQARLWHAEALALGRQVNSEQFRVAGMRLATTRGRLHGRDSLLAEGLVALGNGEFAQGCGIYGQLLARDSLDVLAWYGMGDCQALDASVVRDQGSPSGWRFTSSWHAAATAYMRAVTLEPAAHAALPYSALTLLLPTDVMYVRQGQSSGAEHERFAAYPTLAADTIAFIPYPLAAFAAVRPSTKSASEPDALKRNRDVLLSFARQWSLAAPTSADAFEALALAHEVRGEVVGDEGAMQATRTARSLATTPLQQTRLAAAHVRLQLKLGEFAQARAIADSVLTAWSGVQPEPDVAMRLSGLAALTGRTAMAAELMTRWTSARFADMGVAPPLTESANRFFARAAAGVCDDTLRAQRRDVERVLESYSQPSRRDELRALALSRAAALSYPCLRGGTLEGIAVSSPLDRAQRAHAAGDRGRARAVLDSVARMRAGARPGDIALDHTVQEAWLRAAIGDTAAAIRQLDLVLEALPTLSTLAVREEAQAAAVGRAMTLRADLANARGDRAAARRWASHALDLLAGADAPLQPTLRRLRTLSSAP